MNDILTARCIDINTPYCPCILADLNNCVHCSRLRGEDICDCDWAGICIYYEKYWQKKEVGDTKAKARTQIETEFEICEQISADIFKISIPVTSIFASMLKKIGSFIFIKLIEDPDYFFFPVGIMKVGTENLEVIIEKVGPKSKRIFGEKQKICVKGPYYNGILGQPWIEHVSYGKIILIAGGMGQAPAISIAEHLLTNHNIVTAIIAPGQSQVFAKEDLEKMGCEVFSVCSIRRVGIPMLKDLILTEPKPDLIVSAGPDEQHYGIIDAMKNVNVNLPMAATNNATMCCGEGICGSCKKVMHNGVMIPTCKLQTSFNQFKDNV